MLVYRPDHIAHGWWHEAGGFNIKYPNYSAYKTSANMMAEITRYNALLLEFSMLNKCKWEFFTSNWIAENFGYTIDVPIVHPDVLVTLIKT
jgi:hypothetical protein